MFVFFFDCHFSISPTAKQAFACLFRLENMYEYDIDTGVCYPVVDKHGIGRSEVNSV